jgi:hypothetical protein
MAAALLLLWPALPLLIQAGATQQVSSHVHLGWWTESPASFGCRGEGMPLPSSSGPCWNRTLSLIAQQRENIDRLQVVSGLAVTDESDGMLSAVTVHSDNVTKTFPLELLGKWVPEVRAALGTEEGKSLDALLLLSSTSAAHAAYRRADALASQLVNLTVAHGFDGINVDYESSCCKGSPDGRCACDASEAGQLATFLGTLSSSLRAVGKTVTLCVNENGAGFLRTPYLQRYLDVGRVTRLMQMGTYGVGHFHTRALSVQHRDNLTRTLLDSYPTHRLGLGIATTVHYGQNVSSLRDWFRVLQPYIGRASAALPLEVDVYYLQGGDPDPVQGGWDSPPDDWWPVLSELRHHAGQPPAMKHDDDGAAQLMERMEPGGWGALLDMARHPTDFSLWAAGFDVGGLAFSLNDGQQWSDACNPQIETLQIFSVKFVHLGAAVDIDEHALLLATSVGVYVGTAISSNASLCPWRFEPSNDGLELANASAGMSSTHHKFSHPIRRLASSEIGTLWAGVGDINDGGPESKKHQGDPVHVYCSTDGAKNWKGMLTLPGGGAVEDISVGKTSWRAGSVQESVVVSSATGLFVTHDAGKHWIEAGSAPLKFTVDAGKHWRTCVSDDGASEPCPFPSGKACTSNTTIGAGLCLPVAGAGADYNETRSNTRATAVVDGRIFVTVFDVKSFPTTSHCSFTYNDPELLHYRGGPWVSEDGGFRWRWLFRDARNGSATYPKARLRCPGVSDGYSTTNFPQMAIDPAAPTEHIFLGGWGSSAQGLTELRGGHWNYWDECGAPSSASTHGNINITNEDALYGCYEGRRPNTFQRDCNMYVFAMRVIDWNSTERRVITNGTVIQQPVRQGGDGSEPRSLLFLSGFRGAVRAAWDGVNDRYSFKQFGDTLVNASVAPPIWRSNGLGDTCAMDVVWRDSKNASSFVAAVEDGGLAGTHDRGSTWQRPSELWPGRLGTATAVGSAVTSDGLPDGCVYAAHNDRGATGLASVLRQCSNGPWTVIGGQGYAGSSAGDGANGMGGTTYVRSLHVLAPTSPAVGGPSASSSASSRLLAAATNTLLVFDESHAPGAQWHCLNLSSLPGLQRAETALTCGPGKAELSSDGSIAIVACGTALFLLDIKTLQISPVTVSGATLSAHQHWTAVEVWPTTSTPSLSNTTSRHSQLKGGSSTKSHWNIALGTQYPPNVYVGNLTVVHVDTSLLHIAASATVKQTFDPSHQYNASALSLYTITSLARTPDPDGTIGCSVFVGNYFDDDKPPSLYQSTDSGMSFHTHPQNHLITNTDVHMLVVDPDGKICLCTDGNGIICVGSGDDHH